MRRTVALSVFALASLLAAGLPVIAEGSQTQPASGKLAVTYYFLPG